MSTDDFDPLARARAQWRWRGKDRPRFADIPAQGQISVWDFPRPPELVRDEREIVVLWGALEVARTRAAWAVRETAHPPTFYLPLVDVHPALLRPAGGGSFCEWKGPARYWDLVDGARRLAKVAWSYPQPLAGAEPLAAASVQAVIKGAEARLTGRGRLLIRKSGTEPLIRVMAECEDEAMLAEVVDGIVAAVRAAV